MLTGTETTSLQHDMPHVLQRVQDRQGVSFLDYVNTLVAMFLRSLALLLFDLFVLASLSIISVVNVASDDLYQKIV